MVSEHLLALDVGERRIGVAMADTSVKIAVPYDTLSVDGTEIEQITKLVQQQPVARLVIGYPRNQSGGPTAQTQYVLDFTARLPKELAKIVIYQDESVTSVQAEQQLKASRKPYAKGDIDKLAASIILQDYLELNYGRL